jgi:hypothetical protein
LKGTRLPVFTAAVAGLPMVHWSDAIVTPLMRYQAPHPTRGVLSGRLSSPRSRPRFWRRHPARRAVR